MMTAFAAAEKNDIIGPEGMEKFCEDIGVEPENVCEHYCAFHHSEYSILCETLVQFDYC